MKFYLIEKYFYLILNSKYCGIAGHALIALGVCKGLFSVIQLINLQFSVLSPKGQKKLQFRKAA